MAKKEKPTPDKEKKQNKTGRPRKFEGPTQNFYITLPTEVVQRLKLVDEHLATAIVKLSAGAGLLAVQSPDLAEINQALLPVVITAEEWAISLPNFLLQQIEGVRLIPYENRCLLALEQHLDPRDLELRLRDFLDLEDLESTDRDLLEQLVQQLSQGRRQGIISTVQLLLYGAREELPTVKV